MRGGARELVETLEAVDGVWEGVEPDAVLGVEPGVSPQQLREAYEALVKKHQPERVAHLGEELRELVEERLRAVHAAYDELTR